MDRFFAWRNKRFINFLENPYFCQRKTFLKILTNIIILACNHCTSESIKENEFEANVSKKVIITKPKSDMKTS